MDDDTIERDDEGTTFLDLCRGLAIILLAAGAGIMLVCLGLAALFAAMS